MGESSRRELITKLVNDHGIRGVSQYVEQIVAEALDGRRRDGVNAKGYDVESPLYGRVEVKYRQLPRDGRKEERVQINGSKEGEFDYLAIVILKQDFGLKGAVLIPYHEAWAFVEKSAWNRISYAQACGCDGAIDITKAVGIANEK